MTKDEHIKLIISKNLCDAYSMCDEEYPEITVQEFTEYLLLETLRLFKNTIIDSK